MIGTMLGAVSAQRGAPPVPAPMPAVLRDYGPVTAERLKNPEDENWLMIRRTYDGWGFSPLTQITPGNVARLRPAWVFSTAEARVHQAAPIVNAGVMFVTSPGSRDRRTGAACS
jgi:alcohol dehydrogenase (cytochrome c)